MGYFVLKSGFFVYIYIDIPVCFYLIRPAMYFRCVFLLLAVAVVRSAFPQNIRRITHRDGLSNSSILSLAQDADGYIWAGSCDGLNLWDGNSARHFRLSGNLIQEIVATDDGYLWVRTNYGVDRFDTRDRRIEMLAGFQRVYKFAARSRDEAFFLHGQQVVRICGVAGCVRAGRCPRGGA